MEVTISLETKGPAATPAKFQSNTITKSKGKKIFTKASARDNMALNLI
jgi:hypothetical protein